MTLALKIDLQVLAMVEQTQLVVTHRVPTVTPTSMTWMLSKSVITPLGLWALKIQTHLHTSLLPIAKAMHND